MQCKARPPGFNGAGQFVGQRNRSSEFPPISDGGLAIPVVSTPLLNTVLET